MIYNVTTTKLNKRVISSLQRVAGVLKTVSNDVRKRFMQKHAETMNGKLLTHLQVHRLPGSPNC